MRKGNEGCPRGFFAQREMRTVSSGAVAVLQFLRGRTLASVILLLSCLIAGCSTAQTGQATGTRRERTAPIEQIVDAGRVSLTLPEVTQRTVVDASYNGVEIRSVVPDPLKPGASEDQLWAAKFHNISNEFGTRGKGRVLSTEPFDGHKAVFYKYNAADPVGPGTLVNFDVWTAVSGKLLEVSVSAGYDEQNTIQQQTRRVLANLAPPQGKVTGGTFVVPESYLQLPPDLGESVNASFRFGQGYELMVKTDVLQHPKSSKDIPGVLQAPPPPEFSRKVLENGSTSAGPLRGTQAVVVLQSRSDGAQSFVALFHYPGVEGGKPLTPTVDLEMKGGPVKDAAAAQAFLAAWHAALNSFTIRTR